MTWIQPLKVTVEVRVQKIQTNHPKIAQNLIKYPESPKLPIFSPSIDKESNSNFNYRSSSEFVLQINHPILTAKRCLTYDWSFWLTYHSCCKRFNNFASLNIQIVIIQSQRHSIHQVSCHNFSWKYSSCWQMSCYLLTKWWRYILHWNDLIITSAASKNIKSTLSAPTNVVYLQFLAGMSWIFIYFQFRIFGLYGTKNWFTADLKARRSRLNC